MEKITSFYGATVIHIMQLASVTIALLLSAPAGDALMID